ncbi:Leucine rich repeat protein [Spraguea lophii 42_110]|uniref:Leucine rich repeat protein n=1 Tax=Spraguea lophii (strain 42_110) TaxID=1358809 RepID=S7XSW1_SPRLO|nr:Leucine rich repeat protein [Spraguea lophii 42_110]
MFYFFLHFMFCVCPFIERLRSFAEHNDDLQILYESFLDSLKHSHISVDEIEGVTTLRIFGSPKVLNLPDTIGLLTDLRGLHYTHCNGDKLPYSFRGLRKLERLDISANNFLSIPNEMYSLINLKYLNISSNKIIEIGEKIFNLKILEKFYCGKNKFVKISDKFFELQNIKYFDLEGNEYFGRSPFLNRNASEFVFNISKLKDSLISLNLKKTCVNEMYLEFNLSKLEYLDISSNNLMNIPSSLRNCSNLQSFIACDNKFNFIPIFLFSLPKLKILQMRWCNIIQPLRLNPNDFPVLEKLSLPGNSFISLDIKCFTSPNLSIFHLAGRSIQKINLKELNIPNIKILIINENLNQIEGDFGNYKNLENLTLTVSKLCIIYKKLFGLINLKQLLLIAKKKDIVMFKYILNSLESSKQLNFITLSNCSLNEIPEVLFSLEMLEVIQLPNNNIKTIPDEISHLKNLKTFILNNNKIDTLSIKLFSLPNLTRLDVMNNKIGHFPYESYKFLQNSVINFDIYLLNWMATGNDIGLLDLPERYIHDISIDHFKDFDLTTPCEMYEYLENKYVKWDITNFLAIKPQVLTPHSGNFEFIEKIWNSSIKNKISESKMSDEIWEYIKAIYDKPSEIEILNINFNQGKENLKDYIENIILLLESKAEDKNILESTLLFMHDGIRFCFEGQLESLRTAYLTLKNEFRDENDMVNFINNIIADMKEDILRKITSSASQEQNVHIFSFWKNRLKDELGFLGSETYYGNSFSYEIYESRAYIIYKFIKGILQVSNFCDDVLEVINKNKKLVCLISQFFYTHQDSDIESMKILVKFEGDIEYLIITGITETGLLFLLHDMKLVYIAE